MDGFESFRTQVNELEQKLNDQRLKLEQANGQFNALVAFKQVELAKLKELQAKIRYENHCLADCEYNTHELLAPYEKMQEHVKTKEHAVVEQYKHLSEMERHIQSLNEVKNEMQGKFNDHKAASAGYFEKTKLASQIRSDKADIVNLNALLLELYSSERQLHNDIIVTDAKKANVNSAKERLQVQLDELRQQLHVANADTSRLLQKEIENVSSLSALRNEEISLQSQREKLVEEEKTVSRALPKARMLAQQQQVKASYSHGNKSSGGVDDNAFW